MGRSRTSAPGWRRGLWGVVSALVVGLAAPVALAQSAADKATARQLATEGIRLFQGGDHAAALDRLQRAQALYDAPVHLLYIARAQRELGKLVEASETYRRLLRVQLEADAPEAFRTAVEDGRAELAELEPRIPALRIEVTPAEVADLELTIDGQPVPAAVIGVRRPENPGEHRVRVAAPGYVAVEQLVTLEPGETQAVTLALAADPDAQAPQGPKKTSDAGTEQPAASLPPSEPSFIGFMLGLRLAGLVPAGDLTEAVGMDQVGRAGGLELHGGLRFAKYFTGVLFAEGYAHQVPTDAFPPRMTNERRTRTGSLQNAGIGMMIGTERGKLGGYGEIDFLFLHRLVLKAEREFLAEGTSCTETAAYSGTALRIGGGGVWPVADWLQLVVSLHATFGQFTDLSRDQGCGDGDVFPPLGLDGEIENPSSHSLFVLGLGGDFLLGGDKP